MLIFNYVIKGKKKKKEGNNHISDCEKLLILKPAKE